MVSKLNLFCCVLSLSFFSPLYVFSGGAVVADGGHAIECQGKLRFLDVMEYEIVHKVKLDHDISNEIIAHADQILAKVSAEYHLTIKEIEALKLVKVQVIKNHMRLWEDVWLRKVFFEFFEIRLPTLSPVIADKIINERCDIIPVAINVPMGIEVPHPYSEVCTVSQGSGSHCLLVNKKVYTWLSPLEKKCLVTHEFLREINETRNIYSGDIELRRLTMRFCI
jgi:hypothetical protein